MGTQPHSSAAREITCRLDELAAEIARGSDTANPDRWAASLSALADFAQASVYASVAPVAREAAETLRNAQGRIAGDQARSQLATVIERLRREFANASPADEEQSPSFNLSDDAELRHDFVFECREHLESIEHQALILHRDPANMEAIHSLFRSFHTIKGLAGFLVFDALQRLAHEVETVLDLARNSKLVITPRVINVFLESKDCVASWLNVLEAPADPWPPFPEGDDRLLARIRNLAGGTTHTDTVCKTHSAADRNLQPMPATRFVKVDAAKLDYLMGLVSEMVIAQSLLRCDLDRKREGAGRLELNLAQLARKTEEVQRTAMTMRMVSLVRLYQKTARLVRDLSSMLGKQIRFETEGEDIQLDRNIVEDLAEPLMHMIRNAVDHGIEAPDRRAASGKEPTAVIRLRAFRQGGCICLEVSDDGRGIDRQKVLLRARDRGLVAPSVQLSDSECDNLIFEPGFSTADHMSIVSGRGVGMDVVRKQMQKLCGTVEITSTHGKGTSFLLRVPLTSRSSRALPLPERAPHCPANISERPGSRLCRGQPPV